MTVCRALCEVSVEVVCPGRDIVMFTLDLKSTRRCREVVRSLVILESGEIELKTANMFENSPVRVRQDEV